MYPCVIAYNGRDHFVPTIPTNEQDYLNWKVNKEFGSLCAATLIVAKELNRPTVPAVQAQSIKAIEKVLEEHLPKLSKKAHQYYQNLAKKTSLHRGPSVQPAPGISGPPGSSQDLSGGASTSHTDPGAETEPVKGYKCDKCGVVKQRKPDLRGHLWAKHRVGEPIVCNMGKCDNRDFSHPSSLKQHQRTVHNGDYKFECRKCPYKTDSGSNLTSHLFLKHKIIEKDEEDQPVVYTCELCTKEFPAQYLLTKHMKDKNCVKKKTLKFPHCIRKYKTQEGVDLHIESYHKGKKHPCPKCGILVADKSMRNHLRLHTSRQLLREARAFNSKVKSRQKHFASASKKIAKRTAKKKTEGTPFVSRSAPTKLKKAKSPRGSPRKSPWGGSQKKK